MRTRNRTVIYRMASKGSINAGFTHYKCSGPNATGSQVWAAFNIPAHYANEYMLDELGTASKHPVLHRRYRRELSSILPPYEIPVISSPYGMLSYVGLQTQWPDNFNSLLNVPAGWTLVSPSAIPYGYSYTQLTNDQEISLKNDVLEKAEQLVADMLLNLVQANQAMPSVQSLASCLPNMAKNWGKIRKLIRTASDSYLAWKFGVSPILSDVMSIHKHLPKLGEELRKHNNLEVMRFTRVAELQCNFSAADRTSTPANGFIWSRAIDKGRYTKVPQVRYVLLVKPVLPYASDFFKKLDSAMSRFATSPAQLLWEEVPFSFVVDWFVDLRGTLRTLDKALGQSPYSILGFTRSFSYKATTSTFHKFYNTCNGGLINDQWVGDNEFSHYERSLVSVPGFLPVWKPRFGKNQAGISAALISQQLGRLSR